jgi:histidyl-tRNA synthetase
MAKPSFRTHHGMHDILPDESPKWVALEAIVRETAKRFHFHEIRTPIMEDTALIARGVGELTDIVSKEMFAFNRGDDQYVLRPEGTASVSRAYIQHNLDQRGGVQRLFYIGPMFRAERPQKGRQRQFHQFGVEVLGSAEPMADTETIAFMVEVIKRIGISRFTLKLNSVGDIESRTAYKEALINYFTPLKSQLSEVSQQRLAQNPMRILDSKDEGDKALVENAPKILDYLNEDCASHFEAVKAQLTHLGIAFEIDPLLVRGLDYYSKTAFEISSPDLGAQDALGGGGRYDLLVEELGGKKTPAVGFACGMERLLIASEALGLNLVNEHRPDVIMVSLGEEAQNWSLKAAHELRALGLDVTMHYSGGSMKAQMKNANRENTKYCIIVGDNELAENSFVLRDMDKSDEQKLDWNQIKAHLTA